MKRILLVIAVICIMASSAMAGNKDSLRIMGYYDTVRDQESVTLTGPAKLPHNFGIWGFVDFYTPRGDEDLNNEADMTSFYGEFNIHYQYKLNGNPKRQLRPMLEIDDASYLKAILRPGVQYFHKADWGKFAFKVLPYRLELVEQDPMPDPSGQVGIAWRINLLDKKVFFEGFADLNWFWENQEDFYPFITEPQLGFNLTERTSLVAEYRYVNLSPHMDDEGLGIGFEYRF